MPNSELSPVRLIQLGGFADEVLHEPCVSDGRMRAPWPLVRKGELYTGLPPRPIGGPLDYVTLNPKIVSLHQKETGRTLGQSDRVQRSTNATTAKTFDRILPG